MYIEEIATQIAGEIEPGKLPDSGDVGQLLRAYALLVLVRGGEVNASDVHDAWASWMAGVDPAHPALRPYGQLDRETQAEDAPFLAAVRAVAERVRR